MIRPFTGRVRAASLAVLAATVIAGAALATTVVRLDLQGLTHLSTHVVVGKVAATRAELTPDGGAVMTLADVAVAETWKGGPLPATVTVRIPGGQIGDLVMEVPGSPELVRGHEVLLFLEANPDGSFGVVTLAQGSYRIQGTADGSAIVLADPAAAELLAVGAGAAPVEQPLSAVAGEVRRAVAAEVAALAAGQPAPDPLAPAEIVHKLHDVK